MPAPPEELESRIGYQFRDRDLLLRALTHKSLRAESAADVQHNELLEFLGDSILGFLASEFVFRLVPNAREGDLSRLKAHLVSASRLYEVALALDLGSFLQLGRGEERSGGRSKKTLLADAFEALLAAIYLDAGPREGLEICRRLLERFLWPAVESAAASASEIPVDPKNALQELAQARRLPMPRYALIAQSGPEHARLFTVEARLGPGRSAAAQASSKKAASQKAAALLLEQLRAESGTEPAQPAAGDGDPD
ncbi:MAG: ribonuclease III [Bryobacteraceae bacterium]|nr:ribonuclease III [Bryobacteraceae bacterium]